MGSQILKISFFSLFFLFAAFSAQAANPLDVVINEVAWMGTEVSYNDEWIELYNNTDSPINLGSWVLKAADGSPEIKLTGNVLANEFYLLERTDDSTLPNISADQIYTGALGNAGEKLELYGSLGNLIDSVDASSGWPAGDNSTKQTMEKTDSGWQTSQEPGGTPKSKNSKAADNGSPQTLPAALSTTTGESYEVEPRKIYPPGVIINEILPSPIGPDEQEEWIEVFNKNNFEINLSGWQITDTEGRANTYIFPEGTKISPNDFLVLPRPTTKITLNNQGDGLKLTQPDGNVVSELNYENAPRGESYGLFGSNWGWTPAPSPGSANILPAPTPEPEEKNNEPIRPFDAAQGKQTSKSFFPFFTALSLAVFSGTIILFLKRGLTA